MTARADAFLSLYLSQAAIRDASESLRLQDADPQALHIRGLAHAQLGNTRQAVLDYTAAIENGSDGAASYFNRGQLYSKRDMHYLALKDYGIAHRLQPDNGLIRERFCMTSLLTNPDARCGSPTAKRKQITGVDPPWMMVAEAPWEGGNSQEAARFPEIHRHYQTMAGISENMQGQVWGEAVLVHLEDSREFTSEKNTLSCISQVNILRTALDFRKSPLFSSAIMPPEFRDQWEDFIKYFLEVIVIPIYRESLSFRWDMNELMLTVGGRHAYSVEFDLKHEDGGESMLNAYFIAIGRSGTQIILLRTDKRKYVNRSAEFKNMLQSLSYWGD